MILLLISIVLGYCLIKLFLKIEKMTMLLAGSFLIGSLVSGTALYLLDILLLKATGGYFTSNMIFSTIALILIFIYFYLNRKTITIDKCLNKIFDEKYTIVLLFVFLFYSIWINYYTFYLDAGNIIIRGGTGSDIMYHNSYLRSVKLGSNVPTTYPYYANAQIHYHFMFDYFGGKIAQFGLNTIHSLNILSSLSLCSLLLLLFEFGRVYFKNYVIGLITPILLVLHSSAAAFAWLFQDNHRISGWLKGVNFEGWGLFNVNVFINQRHFAFSLAICVLIVLYIIINRDEVAKTDQVIHNGKIVKYIPIAIIIGILPFWNAILAVICIMFVGLLGITEITRNKKNSLGLIISGIISGVAVVPQLMMFKAGDSVLSQYPSVHFGYEIGALGVVSFFTYYYKVLGVKFFLILISFIFIDIRKKVDYIIFLIPFIMANTIQFGKVLYDNNKFMLVSIMLLNAYAAYTIVNIYKLPINLKKIAKCCGDSRKSDLYKFLGKSKVIGVASKYIAIVVFISVVLAGAVDLMTVTKMQPISIKDENSQLKQWIIENTPKDSIFLTSSFIRNRDNAISAITLSGRMLYCVRNNIDSSVNLETRTKNIRKIYTFQDGTKKTIELLKREKIKFLLVDSTITNSTEFKFSKKAFDENFNVAYSGNNEYNDEDVKIYVLR